MTTRRPEQQKWFAGETISLGIGQGYNNFTMLQLAQATATLANNGVKNKPASWSPRRMRSATPGCRLPVQPPENLDFKPENVAVVRKAMVGVNQEGTSAACLPRCAATLSGGKTGTAQAVAMGRRRSTTPRKMDEHQRDHALYMAFAPADDPKIALPPSSRTPASARPLPRRSRAVSSTTG